MNYEFMYDEENDELFRFSKDKKEWKKNNITHIPTKANRYKTIEINRKKFLLHRVIYFICNEHFDIFDSNIIIDHADRNTGNNTSKNLSIRTQSQNCQNRKGVKGMILEKSKSYRVHWSKDKKCYRKTVKNYYLANWLRKTKTSHYYLGIN